MSSRSCDQEAPRKLVRLLIAPRKTAPPPFVAAAVAGLPIRHESNGGASQRARAMLSLRRFLLLAAARRAKADRDSSAPAFARCKQTPRLAFEALTVVPPARRKPGSDPADSPP